MAASWRRIYGHGVFTGNRSGCCRPGGCRLDGSAWKLLIVLVTPVVLAPLPAISQTPESRCGYIILLVAIYWTTEALPLGVTGLIPAMLFPLFGIIPSKDIAMDYMKEAVLLFLGSFVVACAFEKWELHTRIALRMILITGYTLPRLLLGFMLPSLVLSMWISNTATTTMMIPIVEAVLQQLKRHMVKAPDEEELKNLKENDNDADSTGSEHCKSDTDSEHFRRVCKAMCLSVAYASTCGGTSTLIGTGTNILLKSQADGFFDQFGLESGITFANWMLFAFPLAVICMLLCWLWLQIHWFGLRNTLKGLNFCSKEDNAEQVESVKQVLHEEYKKLGPLTFAEKAVLFHFVFLSLLWLTLDPGFIPGWGSLLPDGYVTAMVPAIFIAVLLFISPAYNPFDSCGAKKVWRHEPLMDLQTMMDKVPWHILLLFGGGMAIAHGCQESGLSEWAGGHLAGLGSVPPGVLIFVICICVSFFTEFTTNTAVIAILLPVLMQMAVVIKVHPLLLIIPAGISCSYAFMLPVATPPNAIVFSYGHLKVIDMVKSGFVLNLMCVCMVTLAANTWGYAIFGYHQLSPILTGESQNVTSLNVTSTVSS